MIGFGIFLHAAQTESLSICSGTGTLIASNRPSRPPSGASESYATLPPIHEEVQVECVCTCLFISHTIIRSPRNIKFVLSVLGTSNFLLNTVKFLQKIL